MDAKPNVSSNFIRSLWKFFASVKLTVVLLLCLAVFSILGTVIPQNARPEEYVRIFGMFRYQLFLMLDIVDMYHSWWFSGLMLFLVANIVVCSIDRLKITWKMIFTRDPKFNIAQFRQSKNRIEFEAATAAAGLSKPFYGLVSRHFRFCRVVETKKGFAITAEKGRLSRLGVYLVHFSIVVLLFGGLIGSKYGFEGFMALPEGQTADTIELNNSGKELKLPFQVRCDNFEVQFYQGGRPKEFRSTLTILENGKPVVKRDILVNDPLYYHGIGIYQSSYGRMDEKMPPVAKLDHPPSEVELHIQSVASGMVYTLKAHMGATVEIPEGLGRLTVEKYEPEAKFNQMSLGPALLVRLTPKAGAAETITLPFQFPKFDTMRRGQVIISAVAPLAAAAQERYYTGLQVVYDPGVGMVYAGFLLMIAGCWVA